MAKPIEGFPDQRKRTGSVTFSSHCNTRKMDNLHRSSDIVCFRSNIQVNAAY